MCVGSSAISMVPSVTIIEDGDTRAGRILGQMSTEESLSERFYSVAEASLSYHILCQDSNQIA